MTNSPEQRVIIAEIYDDIRKKDISSAFRGCQRLAYQISDYASFAYFLYEQEHGDQEAFRHLLEALGDLNKEQAEFLHEMAINRKLRNRAYDESTCKLLGLKTDTVFWVGCGQIDAEIKAKSEVIRALEIPANVNEVDAAFFYKENELLKLREIHGRTAIEKIKEKLLTAAFNYASLVEKKLFWSENDRATIADIENAIFSFLGDVSPHALSQLQKASLLIKSDDQEDRSQAALLIRRCVNSVADAVQPEDQTIDGLEIDKPLNRISYYMENFSGKMDKTRVVFKPKELEKMLRALNDKSSKGVHSNISRFELQQIYLAVVLYLGNIAQISGFRKL